MPPLPGFRVGTIAELGAKGRGRSGQGGRPIRCPARGHPRAAPDPPTPVHGGGRFSPPSGRAPPSSRSSNDEAVGRVLRTHHCRRFHKERWVQRIYPTLGRPPCPAAITPVGKERRDRRGNDARAARLPPPLVGEGWGEGAARKHAPGRQPLKRMLVIRISDPGHSSPGTSPASHPRHPVRPRATAPLAPTRADRRRTGRLRSSRNRRPRHRAQRNRTGA